MARDTTYQLRVSNKEKTRFVKVCVKRKRVPADVLREYMAEYAQKYGTTSKKS